MLQLDRSRTGGSGAALAGSEAGGDGGGSSKSRVLWEEALCIEASFKVYGANVSGLAVDALHLVNETYKLYKGVRYTTMSGRFVVRV